MSLQLSVDLGFVAGVLVGSCTCLLVLRRSSPSAFSLSSSPTRRFVVGSNDESCCTGDASGGEEGDAGVAERDAFWFEENLTPFFAVKMALRAISFESRSAFQRVQVVQTAQFGRTLVMDGQTQSAEADEHIYHESLVHPAMLLHPNPERVYIGGGGEFATAREVLRHKSVKQCVMVDIDKVACDICREQLPEWNGGAYEDDRFSVFYSDAKLWLEENENERFDVIILDICDPIEAGPGYKLYTQEFYEFLKSRLNHNGIVVTQSGPGAVYNAKEECFTVIHNTLKSVFKCVIPFATDVPSFGCNWGFNLAVINSDTQSSNEAAAAETTKIRNMPVSEIDDIIAERITGELKFLDGLSFKGIVGIPKSIRISCDEENRVMTIDNPVFMYAK